VVSSGGALIACSSDSCVRVVQSPAHAGSSLADFYTLKMEAIRSSETSVKIMSTWLYIPEDSILYITH
jgi:hypothetical protein